jgi:hypothetical protein
VIAQIRTENGGNGVQLARSKDEEFALDVLDFFVNVVATASKVGELNSILATGGSEWEVAKVGEERWQLSKRSIGPIAETIESIRTASQRAHAHLMTAYAKLTGRDPDASAAYLEGPTGPAWHRRSGRTAECVPRGGGRRLPYFRASSPAVRWRGLSADLGKVATHYLPKRFPTNVMNPL